MIDPCKIRALSRSQLREYRHFDLDCEGMSCYDCPLGMEPVRAKLPSGQEFVYRCSSAYANYLLRNDK